MNISLTTSYSFFNPKLSLFLQSIRNPFFFWGFCSFSQIKGTQRMSEEGVKFWTLWSVGAAMSISSPVWEGCLSCPQVASRWQFSGFLSPVVMGMEKQWWMLMRQSCWPQTDALGSKPSDQRLWPGKKHHPQPYLPADHQLQNLGLCYFHPSPTVFQHSNQNCFHLPFAKVNEVCSKRALQSSEHLCSALSQF